MHSSNWHVTLCEAIADYEADLREQETTDAMYAEEMERMCAETDKYDREFAEWSDAYVDTYFNGPD